MISDLGVVMDIINIFKNYSELIQAVGSFIPIIWAIYVVVEWFSYNRYYRNFHIEHSYKPNFKIVFNPSYILNFMFSLFVWVVVFFIQHIYGAKLIGFLTLLGIVIYDFVCRKKADDKMKLLFDNEVSEVSDVNNNLKEYREVYKKWCKHDDGMRTSWMFIVIWVMGLSQIVLPEQSDLMQLINKFRDGISIDFSLFGGLRNLTYVIWFLLTCVFVQNLFNKYVNSYNPSLEHIDYLQVFLKDNKMYAILAPTKTDNNEICVAVRTVICRKKNGIVFGYLIQNDVVTRKAPFVGNSFLIDTDKVSFLPDENRQSNFFRESDIVEQFNKDKILEYLKENKTWTNVSEFAQKSLGNNSISDN